MTQNKTNFISTLQQEAKKQSSLNETRILPKSLDPLTALIGNYPWQVLLAASGITAFLLEIFGHALI